MTSSLTVRLDPDTSETLRSWAKERGIRPGVVARKWIGERLRHYTADAACSFCGKPARLVNRVVAGPHGVGICNECVGLCVEIIEDEQNGLEG